MVLTGQQPNYLPWLGLFYKIVQADIFAIVDTVQFIKKSVITRNKIKTKDGWQWLSVPVLTKEKRYQLIHNVTINNALPWRRKHWRSIVLNYSKAPNFAKYADFFEHIYKQEWEKLAVLNETIIRYLIKELGINVKIMRTSDFHPAGQKTDLLIDMCKKLGADTYISGAGARKYVDEKKMAEAGLKHIFLDFKHPVYSQQWGEFQSYMSVIDLLFNHGEYSLEIIMDQKGQGTDA